MANHLKRDPTRTTLQRRQYAAAMAKRFKALRQAVWEAVAVDDVLGLAPTSVITNAPGQFKFLTSADKVKAFREWLDKQIAAGVLRPVGTTGQPWQAPYIESAYRKGTLRSFLDANKDFYAGKDKRFYAGGKAQFLKDAFSQPEATSKLELLYTRSYEALKGITDTMASKVSGVLADGIAAGTNPRELARELASVVDSIGRVRAETLARTEIIHAHAEGQLDSLERLGVDEVLADVEISTAGDNRVCPTCQGLAGKVYTIAEARGIIPVHPNCRCAWVPAIRRRQQAA